MFLRIIFSPLEILEITPEKNIMKDNYIYMFNKNISSGQESDEKFNFDSDANQNSDFKSPKFNHLESHEKQKIQQPFERNHSDHDSSSSEGENDESEMKRYGFGNVKIL